MTRQKSVAISVASKAQIHWIAPRFNVHLVQSANDVPEYDVSRFDDWGHIDVETIGDWEAYRSINNLRIRPVPNSSYPRLVLGLQKRRKFNYAITNVPPGNLLKDLRALYRMSRKGKNLDRSFKKKVLELAHKYTPYATYLPGKDNISGLTLDKWLEVACEVHVISGVIKELNALKQINTSNKADHFKEWVERRYKSTPVSDPVHKYLLRVKSKYTDYINPESFRGTIKTKSNREEKVIAHRKQSQVAALSTLRERMAMHLRERLGHHSLSFLAILDSSAISEKYTYQIACEVGVLEWASLLLAEQLPSKGHIQICQVCNQTFVSKKYDARFCSSTCRSRRSRERKSEWHK